MVFVLRFSGKLKSVCVPQCKILRFSWRESVVHFFLIGAGWITVGGVKAVSSHCGLKMAATDGKESETQISSKIQPPPRLTLAASTPNRVTPSSHLLYIKGFMVQSLDVSICCEIVPLCVKKKHLFIFIFFCNLKFEAMFERENLKKIWTFHWPFSPSRWFSICIWIWEKYIKNAVGLENIDLKLVYPWCGSIEFHFL